MKYRIEAIDLLIRPLPADRFDFAIGKQVTPPEDAKTDPRQPPRRPPAFGVCRLTLKTDDGRTIIGCSGDRPSYGWLDKRRNRDPLTKLRTLVELMHSARDIWLAKPEFDSLFPHWLARHREIEAVGAEQGHEPLSSAFASAFIERAVTDAVCRAEGLSIFEAVKQDRLGIDPGLVHPELKGIRVSDWIPARPRTRFFIRHTVGLTDPLTPADVTERVNDGEPESLIEYAARDGLHYYKIKISGDADRDIERLSRIWELIPISPSTALTLDGNEAYTSLPKFNAFVSRLEYEAPGLFQHIRFIEQPLTRALTLDPKTKRWIERIKQHKPLIIDEADGTLDSFKLAHEIGYSGTSHKNCKGFFKSLLNLALCKKYANDGEWAFLSGEDLSNMPIVPLQQDFAALGVLGLRDCERNGHHYGLGLSHLNDTEKEAVLEKHSDLYERRGDEIFLRIVDGKVDCATLQVTGFGVDASTMPQWESLTPMQTWLDDKYPAKISPA